MTDVVLIYPYVDPPGNRSIFRFPPLGLGYIASFLRNNGVSVELVDCTFMGEVKALRKIHRLRPSIVGIYSMFTMREASLRMARMLRGTCDLLVAGGPLPTIEPLPFMKEFDVVVIGEGEMAMLEIARAHKEGAKGFEDIRSIVHRIGGVSPGGPGREGAVFQTSGRDIIQDLDTIPFPARDLFDNKEYQEYFRRTHGYATTSIITSRGCPFSCDFCSKPVFGDKFRERSAENIVDEIEDIISLGYESVFFIDDCFTLTKRRVLNVCDEIEKRGLNFRWECLSRVDTIDDEMAEKMREAGCSRIFFGLESGNDQILRVMNKRATVEMGRRAVEAAHGAGIKTGAFFILGYPGETDETMLETIRFANSLPLDYLSFTFPYPIPGTSLFEKLRDRLFEAEPVTGKKKIIDHKLIYESDFSQSKLEFAVLKGMIQFYMKKYLGSLSPLAEKPFRAVTDMIFRAMR